PRVPCRLHREVRDLVQAQIVRVVEEAAARTGQVDEQVRIQHALRSNRRRADTWRVAAEERGLRIFGRSRDLELRSDILPDTNARLARGEEAGNGFEIDYARRINAARIDTGLARSVERPGLAGEHVKPEIGSIDFEGHLPHPRVERIGGDRVRGLCRA